MRLPTQLTTVTPYSKIVAATLFIVLPFFGFFLGMWYQAIVDQSRLEPSAMVAYSSPTPSQQYSETPQSSLPIDSEGNSGIMTWKTYTNPAYSYSVQYPSEWSGPQDAKETIPSDNNVIALFKYAANSTQAIKDNNIRVFITVNPLKTSFEDYIKLHTSTLPSNTTNVSAAVAGIEGIRWTYQGERTITEVAAPKSGKVYTIMTQYRDTEPTVFNQILSTFRFTQ